MLGFIASFHYPDEILKKTCFSKSPAAKNAIQNEGHRLEDGRGMMFRVWNSASLLLICVALSKLTKFSELQFSYL